MYEVGQTIYTILEDKYKVVPLKVSEQIVTKTLDGETVTYKAIMPNKKLSKIDLSKLENIYTDINIVKNYMLQNAEAAINDVLKETVTVENKYFKVKESNIACNIESNDNIINSLPPPKKDPDEKIKVELSDGTTANLNIKSIEQVLDQKKNENINS
tara:strand:+ start:190 stop:660 length:471 start_codon:yes stop_codon:yes gene_type:complete